MVAFLCFKSHFAVISLLTFAIKLPFLSTFLSSHHRNDSNFTVIPGCLSDIFMPQYFLFFWQWSIEIWNTFSLQIMKGEVKIQVREFFSCSLFGLSPATVETIPCIPGSSGLMKYINTADTRIKRESITQFYSGMQAFPVFPCFM